MHIWATIILLNRRFTCTEFKQKAKFSQLKGLGHSCLVHFVNNKHLLDEFVVIFGIIKVKVSVICRAEGRG